MKGRPLDAKNRFYKTLRISKELKELIRWYNEAKRIALKKLKE